MAFIDINSMRELEPTEVGGYEKELHEHASITKDLDWRWSMAEGRLNQFVADCLDDKFDLFLKSCKLAFIDVQAHEATKDVFALFALLARLKSSSPIIGMDKGGALDSMHDAMLHVNETEMRAAIDFYYDMLRRHGGSMGTPFWRDFVRKNSITLFQLLDAELDEVARDFASATHSVVALMHVHQGAAKPQGRSVYALFSEYAAKAGQFKEGIMNLISVVKSGSDTLEVVPKLSELHKIVEEIADSQMASVSSEAALARWRGFSARVKEQRAEIMAADGVLRQERIDKELGAMFDLHDETALLNSELSAPFHCPEDCPWARHRIKPAALPLMPHHVVLPAALPVPASLSSGESPDSPLSVSTVSASSASSSSSSSALFDNLASPMTSAATVLQSIAQSAKNDFGECVRYGEALLAYVAKRVPDHTTDALVEAGALEHADAAVIGVGYDKTRYKMTSLMLAAVNSKRTRSRTHHLLVKMSDDGSSVEYPLVLVKGKAKKLRCIETYIAKFLEFAEKREAESKKRARATYYEDLEEDYEQERQSAKRQRAGRGKGGYSMPSGKSIRMNHRPCAIPNCAHLASRSCANSECTLYGREDVGVCDKHLEHRCEFATEYGTCDASGCPYCLRYSPTINDWTCSKHWPIYRRIKMPRDHEVAPADKVDSKVGVRCPNGKCLYNNNRKRRKKTTGHLTFSSDVKKCAHCNEEKSCTTCSRVVKNNNAFVYLCSKECAENYKPAKDDGEDELGDIERRRRRRIDPSKATKAPRVTAALDDAVHSDRSIAADDNDGSWLSTAPLVDEFGLLSDGDDLDLGFLQ